MAEIPRHGIPIRCFAGAIAIPLQCYLLSRSPTRRFAKGELDPCGNHYWRAVLRATRSPPIGSIRSFRHHATVPVAAYSRRTPMPVTIHAAPTRDLTPEEIERWRAVPVPVAVGFGRDVGQIDPAIRPLLPPGRQPRLFGRAVTALCEPPDFGAVLHALDLVEVGDVLVIAAAGHAETAMIGEILGGHLRRRGGSGVVCDGAVRDVGTLAGWDDFSVFTRCITPRGPSSAERGAVNLPVVIAGCLVSPGDLVIGDDDGLVALSPSTVRARIADAEATLAREAGWQANLAAGRSVRETLELAPARRDGSSGAGRG